MISSAIIPRPLAKLPWRLIFLIAGIATFGLIVLYSAAGGSIHPWAIKQCIIFLAFLAIAIGMSWLGEGAIKEVILAVNATVEGQTTAHYTMDRLAGLGVKVSRLAHGVPVGGELDYLDEGTLSAAMRQRTPF